MQMLEGLRLANVKERKVKITEHPTIKINVDNSDAFRELESILDEKDVLWILNS